VDITAWGNIILAALSAITGGGLLKLADTMLNRAKLRNETAKQLRDEAREETTSLKTEINYYKDKIREKDKEIDDWRAKYWDIHFAYNNFQLKVSQILIDNGIPPSALMKDKDEGST
jgi:hypothetical protein